MKAVGLLALVLLLFFPVPARAGNIYGNLWLEGRPLPGARIEIACPAQHAAQTDNNGSYRVFVPEKGRCTFTVRFGNQFAQSAQTEIASYDNPIKYDFDLIRQGAGYILRRR